MSSSLDQPAAPGPRYVVPGRADRIVNRSVAWLTRNGLAIAGSRVLAVQGRTSGEWRTTPVNPLEVDGVRYLVAPRGTTQWVRNLRTAGHGELRVGRRVEPFTATEVADDRKGPLLEAYLARWKWEVGRFFDDPESIDPADFPVFELHPTA